MLLSKLLYMLNLALKHKIEKVQCFPVGVNMAWIISVQNIQQNALKLFIVSVPAETCRWYSVI
jgi:hypothetical protein